MIGPIAGLVGHPRVSVIYRDGRREVVAAASDTSTRGVFVIMIVVLLAGTGTWLRRRTSGVVAN